MRVSWPYGQHESAWGEPTSTNNFCEEDYYLTPYIGEFVNTLTNLVYVAYAIYGLRHGTSKGKPSYIGLLWVGIGSFLYHATLKLSFQLVDDLSMIYATTIVFHSIFTTHCSTSTRRLSAAFLASLTALFTYIHIKHANILLHQVVFASMLGPIFFRCRWVIRRLPREEDRRRLVRLGSVGAVSFMSGFAIWVVDNYFCPQLRDIRRNLGLPWGMVLELHGWWHILTAIGVYAYMVLVERLQLAPPSSSSSEHHSSAGNKVPANQTALGGSGLVPTMIDLDTDKKYD